MQAARKGRCCRAKRAHPQLIGYMRATAAPAPRLRTLDQVRTCGIEIDITTHFDKIRVAVHHYSLEPPLKKMARQPMRLVLSLRIDAVDVTHQPGKLRLPDLDYKVVAIAHHAVSESDGIIAIQRLANNGEEGFPIDVVFIDRFPPVTT